MVFQNFNLFPHMTVLENITLAPVKLKKMDKIEAENTGLELLERVGLKDKAKAYPNQLSGGQKQRVSIARMLLQKTPIMIFDDSLSAVDADTDAKIRSSLKETKGSSTIILISHRITTLMESDTILVLDKGEVSDMGTHEELISRDGIYKDIFNVQMNLSEEI